MHLARTHIHTWNTAGPHEYTTHTAQPRGMDHGMDHRSLTGSSAAAAAVFWRWRRRSAQHGAQQCGVTVSAKGYKKEYYPPKSHIRRLLAASAEPVPPSSLISDSSCLIELMPGLACWLCSAGSSSWPARARQHTGHWALALASTAMSGGGGITSYIKRGWSDEIAARAARPPSSTDDGGSSAPLAAAAAAAASTSAPSSSSSPSSWSGPPRRLFRNETVANVLGKDAPPPQYHTLGTYEAAPPRGSGSTGGGSGGSSGGERQERAASPCPAGWSSGQRQLSLHQSGLLLQPGGTGGGGGGWSSPVVGGGPPPSSAGDSSWVSRPTSQGSSSRFSLESMAADDSLQGQRAPSWRQVSQNG
jgi:hypothetical protein